MFTCEITHNGIRRMLSSDAMDDRMARIAFSQIRKNANGPCEIHDETITQHATIAAMQAEVARFRVAQGKPPEPTEDELRRNAIEVLCPPAAMTGNDNDDHVWW